MRRLFLALIACLAASAAFAANPGAATSDYLVTESAGFVGDSNKGGGFKFSIIFSAGAQLSEKRFATAAFENPGDATAPLLVNFDLDPAQAMFRTSSPLIFKWKNNHRYTIQVSIFEDEARTKLLGTHIQELDFAIPDKVAATYKVILL